MLYSTACYHPQLYMLVVLQYYQRHLHSRIRLCLADRLIYSSYLRSSSTHEPNDPPKRLYVCLICIRCINNGCYN